MQSPEDTSKLHLRNSELSTQVGNLSTEVMQLKGINSLLRVESDDLKVQIAKLQKKEQQVYKASYFRCTLYILNIYVKVVRNLSAAFNKSLSTFL